MASNSPGCSVFGIWRCPGGFVGLFVKRGAFRRLKAKFHYTSCFGAGSKLVRSQIPLCYLVRTSFEPAPNQLLTSFEPDSVMEFGFKATPCVQVG